MNALKKLASQTAIYGISQIAGRFINYLLVPLHTALFDTAAYGVNTLMYSYVTFFNVLLTYGMETAFFRYSQKHEKPEQVYSTALISLVGSSAVFMIVMSLFAPGVASLIKVGDHPEYVIYFAMILGLDAISAVPFAYLRQQNKPLKFAIIKNINIFTNILLNLYFLVLCPFMHSQKGILLPLYQGHVDVGYIFISNLIASLITLPLLWKEIFEIRKAPFNQALWKQMISYGLPLMVVGFAGMINETLDRIIISYMYDDVEQGLRATGIYGANYKLSILMVLFTQAFRYAAEPFFFSHAASTDKRTVYATVMNYFVLVCLVLFMVVGMYIELFRHFLDERYWSGLHVVPVLLIAQMFLGIYFNLSIWFKLSDNTNKGAVISLIGAAITIIANMALVPVMGYTGCAWATLICYATMVIVSYFMGKKYYPIPYHTGRILLYIIIAVVIYFVSRLFTSFAQASVNVNYAMSAILLLVFAAFAYYSERKYKAQDI